MRSDAPRSVGLALFAAILALGYLTAVAYRALTFSVEEGLDDAEWAFKAFHHPAYYRNYPGLARGERDWEQAVPSLYRWYAWAVVSATGAPDGAILPSKNRNFSQRAAHGYTPAATNDTLRVANVVLYAAMLGLLWLVAARALQRPILATFCVLPIAASPTFWNCVAWRLGPDALLCLMFAASLVTWLFLKGWRQLVATAVLCGLTCSAKQNGLLVLAAYCGYLVATGRGAGRLWRPLAALAMAGTIFCLVNPGTWYGPWAFLKASVRMRGWCANVMALEYGPHAWWQLWFDALPVWPLLPFYAWLLWRCRRESWFAPVAWWGGPLALGTLFTIPAPATRYLGPLELSLYFPVMLAAVTILSGLQRSTKARYTRSEE